MRRTDDEAPHYAVFSSLVVLCPFKHKYFLQHPILKYQWCDRPRCTPKNNKQYVFTWLL